MHLLKGLIKFSLISFGALIMLMVLTVGGLLAWDYVDQKMAERQEHDESTTQTAVPQTT